MEIVTQLTLKWGVQVKHAGYNAEDYFSADDFQSARDAYELACKNIPGYKGLQWVALFANGRMTHEGWQPPKIRYLHDTRTNNDPICSAVGGFINSIPGGSI